MVWHERYLQQAAWTRHLRSYLFDKCSLSRAARILEVGCGTGAVLKDVVVAGRAYGLDLVRASLDECRRHAPSALLARGDALSLPYASGTFDITFCHYLLLWIPDPLRALNEMKRVTRHAGFVLAIAEPDYLARVDGPESLSTLGQQQNAALKAQGAALQRGAELAELFYRADIRIVESGPIQSAAQEDRSIEEWEGEWRVLEADLSGIISRPELEKMRALDQRARERGERFLHVPTYFVHGQV